MGRRKSCSLVSSFRRFSLFLARVVSSRLFFFLSPFSTFHFFRVSPLALGTRVYIPSRVYREKEREREVSFAGLRYIYEAPPPLMVSMCSDATRTCPARVVRVHTRVRGAIPHACARAFAYSSAYTRARTFQSPRRAIRRVGQARKDSCIHTRARAHTHGPHGRELCLARDVKLLAIS